MSDTIHIAVYAGLADWEIGYLTAHVESPAWQREPGRHRIVTVGLTREPVRTQGGLTVVPDVALRDVSPDASAMLVLPGSAVWVQGDALAPFAALARAFRAAGVPVAAICGATFGLAAAGLLDDVAHTSGAAEFLAASGYAGGAHYRADRRAVDDDGLITAGPQSALEFTRAVFARLGVYAPETLESWYGLYSTGDPEHFFALEAA